MVTKFKILESVFLLISGLIVICFFQLFCEALISVCGVMCALAGIALGVFLFYFLHCLYIIAFVFFYKSRVSGVILYKSIFPNGRPKFYFWFYCDFFKKIEDDTK